MVRALYFSPPFLPNDALVSGCKPGGVRTISALDGYHAALLPRLLPAAAFSEMNPSVVLHLPQHGRFRPIVPPVPSSNQGGREGGGGTQCVHGRSRMTIDPRIPTMPGRSTSGFHQPGRHCLHSSAKRREVFDESHEG